MIFAANPSLCLPRIDRPHLVYLDGFLVGLAASEDSAISAAAGDYPAPYAYREQHALESGGEFEYHGEDSLQDQLGRDSSAAKK